MMASPCTAPNTQLRPLSAQRSAAGELLLGGCRAEDLAAAHGTPLLVLDEQTLREACRAYTTALAAHYPPGGRVLYASKALALQAIHALVHQEGLGLDVVSAGELHTALTAGVPAAACVLQGNNKTREELRSALQGQVGRINVDNLDELQTLIALAHETDCTTRVLLRVAPGIEAHTHEFIRTGQEDSKFGLDLKSGQLDTALEWLKGQTHVAWLGLQAHIGSQIFDAQAFDTTAEVMVGLLVEIRERHGLTATELDLGGGLGIVYTDADGPPAIAAVVERLCRAVLDACARADYPPPRLVLEPGRSIVGSAGVTLYRVGARKEVPGIRTYVAVDGGMGDNPRPITYGARYTAEPAGTARPGGERVTIAGRYCESGDILLSDVDLPPLVAGDLLAVYGTGAYTYAMASQYNRVGRPAVLLVSDGRADLIAARESLDDLVRLDRLPARLRGTSA
ncbi:MAG: diaminopimelate decarboxylase [Candidatus Sericytochromatia bacterium]|nr:diaminopimelate decarboxylase [Candidatus Sericytochromatia bacterium]